MFRFVTKCIGQPSARKPFRAWKGGYELHREPSKQAHHYVRPLVARVLQGQAVARVLLKLKAKGFVPDVVIARSGLSEALYFKDVFPHAKLIRFLNSSEGVDAACAHGDVMVYGYGWRPAMPLRSERERWPALAKPSRPACQYQRGLWLDA